MDTVFFPSSVGLTYEQSAVKLVVRVLKSGTILYKMHAHISQLLNVTFVCSCSYYERRRVVKYGVQYLSCITHAQLSKAANRIECEIG